MQEVSVVLLFLPVRRGEWGQAMGVSIELWDKDVDGEEGYTGKECKVTNQRVSTCHISPAQHTLWSWDANSSCKAMHKGRHNQSPCTCCHCRVNAQPPPRSGVFGFELGTWWGNLKLGREKTFRLYIPINTRPWSVIKCAKTANSQWSVCPSLVCFGLRTPSLCSDLTA